MSALGWLASSGGWDGARVRCVLVAAAPQGGSEPILTDAACWKNGCYQKCKQSSQPFLEVVALDLKIMIGRNVRG
ncbi:MAG: hypothetical protein CME61_07955 [Halobacteriovoraceae bacterium]|nr:hypothetical protein [Halobacteriovoraceae bacterium]